MAEKTGDLVQGTLDMLILKTLALEPMHGFGVAARIEQMSQNVFRVNAGSLFVAFIEEPGEAERAPGERTARPVPASAQSDSGARLALRTWLVNQSGIC
jgi:hypothetical protein